MATSDPSAARARVGLPEVLVQWGRIGCIGFGGPPTHIALLRDLCVKRRQWLIRPSSRTRSRPAISCRARHRRNSRSCAPGMSPGRSVRSSAVWHSSFPVWLSSWASRPVFLAASPPSAVLAAGAGAGAAVAAVAVHAGVGLLPASWRRARVHGRWVVYALAGGVAAATVGPWLVVVLLGCGAIELGICHFGKADRLGVHASPFLLPAAATATTGGVLSLIWVAFKVGALSYGGGFVIIPLMHHDAVQHYHWMTDGQFLDAVALGQITPGPVVQTVAVVGYAAAGIAGGLLAAVVAFSPSFVFVLGGLDTSGAAEEHGGPRFLTVPDRPRSARSSASRSHLPLRSVRCGSSRFSAVRHFRCSFSAAASCSHCSVPPRSASSSFSSAHPSPERHTPRRLCCSPLIGVLPRDGRRVVSDEPAFGIANRARLSAART